MSVWEDAQREADIFWEYISPEESKPKCSFQKGSTSTEADNAFENEAHHKENTPPDEMPLLEEREI